MGLTKGKRYCTLLQIFFVALAVILLLLVEFFCLHEYPLIHLNYNYLSKPNVLQLIPTSQRIIKNNNQQNYSEKINKLSTISKQQSITISNYELKNQKLKENIKTYNDTINDYKLKLKSKYIIKNQTNIIRKQKELIQYYRNLENPLSYEQWIKGIGDTSLSNNNFSEICVVPNIAGFKLSQEASRHRDPTSIALHTCTNRLFTSITSNRRYIIIDRSKCDKNNNKQIYNYQSKSILKGDLKLIKDNDDDDDDWELIDNYDPIILIKLKEKTQTIWIKCGCCDYNHYVSLLPLKIKSFTKYNQQLKKYNKLKYIKTPPNVVIFVTDSTSRSNWHRWTVSTDNYLENIMRENKKGSKSKINYDIFEFFRHSTVGWGTGENMKAMINGGSNANKIIDLWEYYDKLGYIIPGIEEYLSVMHGSWNDKNQSNIYVSAQWDQTMEYIFYLTNNVFEVNCKHAGYFQTSKWVDFVINAINNNRKIDKLPYFMIVHMEDNHRANGWFQYNLDQYFRKLIEYLNFDNTIFHLVSDHGSLVGDSTTSQFGRWEVTNPVSLLFIPKIFWNITNQQQNILNINQQRFITHYDFHILWKQIPIYFTNRFDTHNICDIPWINKSLPISTKKEFKAKIYRNLFEEIVSVNRTCDGINAPKGFCFCDIPMSKPITNTLIKNDREYVDFVIKKINDLTGNGKLGCIQLNQNNFNIIAHLEHLKGDIELVIQRSNLNKYETQKLIKNNTLLTFYVFIDLTNKRIRDRDNDRKYGIPILERDGIDTVLIERLDYFKYENCLTTDYNLTKWKTSEEFGYKFRNVQKHTLPPLFKNDEHTKQILRQLNQLNLRLCRCKKETEIL